MLEGIGYIRVSTEDQGKKRNGLEAQEQAIIRFAESNNIVLLDVREEWASGKDGLDLRPILASCIEDAKGKALLVAKLDRFSRSVAFIATQMESLVARKTKLIPCDLGMDVEPFQMHIYASLAQKERELIGQRTKAALQAIKASGKPLGRHAHKNPADYTRALREGRETLSRKAMAYAESMRPIIEPLRQEGLTYEAIADRLNLYGVATPKGKKWSNITVSRIVHRWD